MQVASVRSSARAAYGPFTAASAISLDALDAIFTALVGDATHLAVAVSGGADSMALALLTQAWATKQGIALTAFTVDHGLRAESAAEAAQVAHWMQARGIAHHILTPPPMPQIRNPQTQARERRYAALAEACAARNCTHLLLGHHADDQAETLALQRHRGASPPSRAGMAALSYRGVLMLVRPLLGTRKRSLVSYLQAQDQSWVEDPSNQSDRYARNRLRQLLPEDEIPSLWYEAQRAGEQRQHDEQARNMWLQVHAQLRDSDVSVEYAAWLQLAPEQRMDYLSHVIRAVGKKNFRPRYHETERLCTALARETHGATTLGLCRVTWNAAQINISPEHASRMGVDAALTTPHIHMNSLVRPPFWWFNFPLHQ